MTIKISIDIFCNICGNWDNHLLSNKKTVRRQAKKKGWRRPKLNGCFLDICPKCNENFLISEMADIIIDME